MPVDAVSPEVLVRLVVELVVDRPGRVRLVVDGAPPTRPVALAEQVATTLRTLGRAALVVDAAEFLRPASLRFERGRTDPDEFLDGWLDTGALRREVLVPAATAGSGRVLPRLWDATADRAHRAGYVELPPDGVLVLAGGLLLGRGLPVDRAVHLRMGPTALARNLPADQRWTLPAYARYTKDNDPEGADLVILADHPDRPAVRLR